MKTSKMCALLALSLATIADRSYGGGGSEIGNGGHYVQGPNGVELADLMADLSLNSVEPGVKQELLALAQIWRAHGFYYSYMTRTNGYSLESYRLQQQMGITVPMLDARTLIMNYLVYRDGGEDKVSHLVTSEDIATFFEELIFNPWSKGKFVFVQNDKDFPDSCKEAEEKLKMSDRALEKSQKIMACTVREFGEKPEDARTLLLEPIYRSLTDRQKALALVHQAFHRNPSIRDFHKNIVPMVVASNFALELRERQMNGDRSRLTDEEMAVIASLRNSAKAFGLFLTSDTAWEQIWPYGGGRLNMNLGQPFQSNSKEELFLGVGSSIDSSVPLEQVEFQRAVLLDTIAHVSGESWSHFGRDDALEIALARASFVIPYSGRLRKGSWGSTELNDGYSDTKKLAVFEDGDERVFRIKDSTLRGSRVEGNRAIVENSTVTDSKISHSIVRDSVIEEGSIVALSMLEGFEVRNSTLSYQFCLGEERENIESGHSYRKYMWKLSPSKPMVATPGDKRIFRANRGPDKIKKRSTFWKRDWVDYDGYRYDSEYDAATGKRVEFQLISPEEIEHMKACYRD